jgi:hypothetical protein
MKIRSERAELFHADGQTDMIKVTVPFRNFSKALKNFRTKLCNLPKQFMFPLIHTSTIKEPLPSHTGFGEWYYF